jgi:hypothetical protein
LSHRGEEGVKARDDAHPTMHRSVLNNKQLYGTKLSTVPGLRTPVLFCDAGTRILKSASSQLLNATTWMNQGN